MAAWRMASGIAAFALSAGGVSCGSVHHEEPPGSAPGAGCDVSVALRFRPEIVEGAAESYSCFSYDVGPLQGAFVRSIRWTPNSGAVRLHHATLFAIPADPGVPAPSPRCDETPPSAAGLHAWAPGGTPLSFPPDVALALPRGTTRLWLQAHAVLAPRGARARDADEARVSICATRAQPPHVAAWLAASAPVPAIRPRRTETSSARCRAAAPFHVVSTWPHMHKTGRSFAGSVLRLDGSRALFVEVSPWDFDRQQTYPVDVSLEAGDAVATRCTWTNPSNEFVLPGIRTQDEMCQQGLVVWPAEAAHWAEPCVADAP